MFGIDGFAARDAVGGRAFNGLKWAECRGYNGADNGTVQHSDFERRRAVGKMNNLKRELNEIFTVRMHWHSPYIAGEIVLTSYGNAWAAPARAAWQRSRFRKCIL